MHGLWVPRGVYPCSLWWIFGLSVLVYCECCRYECCRTSICSSTYFQSLSMCTQERKRWIAREFYASFSEEPAHWRPRPWHRCAFTLSPHKAPFLSLPTLTNTCCVYRQQRALITPSRGTEARVTNRTVSLWLLLLLRVINCALSLTQDSPVFCWYMYSHGKLTN